MKKYLTNYLLEIETLLSSDDTDFSELKQSILTKIAFMQHERLIHLIVTFLFAILLFLSFIIYFISGEIFSLALSALILALLIPYISHYYFLENSVQKLYIYYDKITEKITKN